MFRTLISFTPFMVCLFWLIVFALSYRRHNPAKRVLTWFLLTCTVLYFCHALFFTTGPSRPVECVWTLCSLSVYPIYYLYLLALTANVSNNRKCCLILLPGVAAFLTVVFCPGKVADIVRVVLNTFQIVSVCCSGILLLRKFDVLVASCYADTEGKKMTDVRTLLILLVLTSAFSACANFLGRSFFAGDDMLLPVVAALFATMLFALSYIGYTKEFSYKELSDETGEEETPCDRDNDDEIIGRMFDSLMTEDKIYLHKGLRITDIASRIGSCRTYVSNYINRTKGETFSDYINRLRIEDAKALLESESSSKLAAMADRLGFANEQSFYRNFRKFTGMTPVQWKKRNMVNGKSKG